MRPKRLAFSLALLRSPRIIRAYVRVSLAMRWQQTSIAICLALALLSLAHVSYAAAGPSHGVDDPWAQEIVGQAARLFSSNSSIATVKMQVSNEDGQRNLTMKIWSLGEKVLVRIDGPQIKPARRSSKSAATSGTTCRKRDARLNFLLQ